MSVFSITGMSAVNSVDLPLPCGPTIAPHRSFSFSRSTSTAASTLGGKKYGNAPGRTQRVENGFAIRSIAVVIYSTNQLVIRSKLSLIQHRMGQRHVAELERPLGYKVAATM